MTLIPAEDQTILGLCLHGQSESLDKSIFKPIWLQSDLSRKLVEASISLTRDGKEVNPVSVVSRAKLSVPGLLPELIRLRKNGFGQAVMGDAIDHSYQVYVNNKAIEIADEMKNLAQHEPQNVKKWLVQEGSKMATLVREGDTYDPRPSKHLEKSLPTLFSQSLITNGNELLRGGYYSGYLMIWAGVSKHGKTTTLNTHIVDLIVQKHKVVLIRTEGDEQTASAEIACAITGIDLRTEVATGKFQANEEETSEKRQARFKQCVEYLDEYLQVYGWKYCNDEALKRIAKWNHPKAVVIDYMKKTTGLFSKRTGSQDEVGDFADFLLVFAHEEGIWTGSAGQISNEASKKLVKFDNGEQVILYGTARVGQAADEFGLLKRHPRIKNMAHFRVQYDRYFGRLDSVHEIPVDVKRRILEIKRLPMFGF